MKDYVKIFKQNEDISNQDKIIDGALECLDRFGAYFEKEDIMYYMYNAYRYIEFLR